MGVYMGVKMLAYVHTRTCLLASVGRAQILVSEHHTEKEPWSPEEIQRIARMGQGKGKMSLEQLILSQNKEVLQD